VSRIILDGMDKEILRLLYAAQRPLSGNAISQAIGLSAPSTNIRLAKLEEKGILKISQSALPRTFTRTFKTKTGSRSVTISAPAKKLWAIDFPEAAK